MGDSAIIVAISYSLLITLCLWTHFPVIQAQFIDHLFGPTHEDESHDFVEGPRGRVAAPKPVDPCDPTFHRTIRNQPQRSYNYRLGSSNHREEVLCDRDLDRGWYRFDSVAGNTIPTSCPGVNYCGTRAPVWMKGALPGVDEGVLKVHGCVSVQGKCCTTQIPMLVKNCSTFVVYHLEPTPACPSAYCAGYEVPCPPGLMSESGYTPCHFPVDLLETKVSFGLSKDLTQLHFFCDVTLGGHVVPDSVALEVEWLADEESIQSETFGLVQQHKGILKEDKWTVGQTLQCRARARHTTINTFTNLVTSPPFNTGIQIKSSPIITLQEGGKPGFIELESSIPIICPPKKKKKLKVSQQHKGKQRSKRKTGEDEGGEEEAEGCCINLEVSTRGGNTPRCPDGNQLDLVVLSSCSFKVCADEWNTTQRVPIWAVSDGLNGGGKDSSPSTVFVDMRTIDPSPPRWQEINLPQQEVHVLGGDVDEKCQTDEVTTTFDGLHYSNRLEGVFVLYKHEKLPYEVQVLVRKCSTRPLCHCAIGIRFGDFMIAGEVCKTGKLKLWSSTADGGTYIEPNKIPHLPQIMRVDEGRTFQIQFPTGTRVTFGPNLRFIHIQASASDFEKTVGLCGSFDRNPSNDFKTYKGLLTCSTNSSCDDFTKAWRLPIQQSLFQGVFENREEEDEEFQSRGRCSCSGLEKSSTKVHIRPKQASKFASYPYDEYGTEEADEEQENNKCSTTICVDPRGADVTKQLLDLVQDEDFLEGGVGLERDTALVNHLTPVFQNPSVQGDSTRIKEWKADEAEIFCLRMIEGVSTAKLCRDIAGVDVDRHRMTCQREVMLSKSGSWWMEALEQLRWECRNQIYHNVSTWEPQLGRQHGTPPHGILSALCLNNCTRLGSCHNGACACETGWAGSDCSVNVNQPPLATHLIQNGVCDLRNKPCSETLIWGERFAEHPQIKCHFDIYRTASVKSVPTLGESITTEGRLLTFQSIICDVPELPIHDAKIASFYIPGEGLDKTRTVTRLSLSYGLGPKSPPLDYTIYDSLCWTCQGPLTCTPTPTQSCNVLSEPFGSSHDPFLLNNSPFGDSNEGGELRPETPQQAPHPGLGGGPCLLPKDPGPCKKDVVRFFFDPAGLKCLPFIYGGCQGNGNNFATAESCTLVCVKGGKEDVVVPSSSDGLSQLRRLPPKCRSRPAENQQCAQPEVVQYFFDPQRNKCRPVISCHADSYSNAATCAEECE